MIIVEKIWEIVFDLEKLYQKVGFVVNKYGLEGEKVVVYLVFDWFGLMDFFDCNYYCYGYVQYFVEWILGMVVYFEDDGCVLVVFFDYFLKGMDELIFGQYQGKIVKVYLKFGWMGMMDYIVVMDVVVRYYQVSGKMVLVFVVFQIDGLFQNKKVVVQVFCWYVLLLIFWQFVGFGEDCEYDYDDDEGLGFFQCFDDIFVLQYWLIDNLDFFLVGIDFIVMIDSMFYNWFMIEFFIWLVQVCQQGIVCF